MHSKLYISETKKMYDEILIGQVGGLSESCSPDQKAKLVGWGSSRSQDVRFEQFVQNLDFTNATLLDVGCGCGGFWEFLKKNDIKIKSYIGIDIKLDYIEFCKREYCEDIKRGKAFFGIYDLIANLGDSDVHLNDVNVVVASGIFSTPFEGRTDFVKKMILTFNSLGKCGFAFNMENSLGLKEPSLDINYDPLYWLDFIFKHVSHKVVFNSNYHDSDFTIVVRKE